MSAALGRLKRGVRAAIDACSGIDGAAETAGRRRSTCGEWNALNHPAFPPLDCALALDEVAVAQGAVPAIATAYCRELGGYFLPYIDPGADPDTLAGVIFELMRELGEVSARFQRGLADDGRISAREAEGILCEVAQLDLASARLRAGLQAIIDGYGQRVGVEGMGQA